MNVNMYHNNPTYTYTYIPCDLAEMMRARGNICAGPELNAITHPSSMNWCCLPTIIYWA